MRARKKIKTYYTSYLIGKDKSLNKKPGYPEPKSEKQRLLLTQPKSTRL